MRAGNGFPRRATPSRPNRSRRPRCLPRSNRLARRNRPPPDASSETETPASTICPIARATRASPSASASTSTPKPTPPGRASGRRATAREMRRSAMRQTKAAEAYRTPDAPRPSITRSVWRAAGLRRSALSLRSIAPTEARALQASSIPAARAPGPAPVVGSLPQV